MLKCTYQERGIYLPIKKAFELEVNLPGFFLFNRGIEWRLENGKCFNN